MFRPHSGGGRIWVMKRFVTTFLLVSSFTLPAATNLSQIEVYEREAIVKELTYHLNTSSSCDMVLSWDDRGSGADTDGYFFTPATKNQYLIGGAVRNKVKIEKSNDILISEARDIVKVDGDICITTLSEPGGNPKGAPVLLTAPLDWKSIWTDKGSKSKNNGSIWEAIPSDDNYKCLGSIAQSGYETKPDLPNYRCVHISLTEKIIADKTLWSDKGSGANSQVTIFELPNANTFVAVPSRTESAEVYDLKTNASSEPDEKIIEEKLAIRMIQVKKDLGVSAEPEEKKEEKKEEK